MSSPLQPPLRSCLPGEVLDSFTGSGGELTLSDSSDDFMPVTAVGYAGKVANRLATPLSHSQSSVIYL